MVICGHVLILPLLYTLATVTDKSMTGACYCATVPINSMTVAGNCTTKSGDSTMKHAPFF